MYEVRFWNKASENIRTGGKYSHYFDTYDDAMNGAKALLEKAYKDGATNMSINNDFYPIINN